MKIESSYRAALKRKPLFTPDTNLDNGISRYDRWRLIPSMSLHRAPIELGNCIEMRDAESQPSFDIDKSCLIQFSLKLKHESGSEIGHDILLKLFSNGQLNKV